MTMNRISYAPRSIVARVVFALPLLAGALTLVAWSAEPLRTIDQGPVRTAEVMPAFSGGNEALATYIASHVVYPAGPKSAGIQGTVYVHFVVAADGTIQDVKAPRPVNPELEAEAIRVVSAMPTWTPGMQGGKPIPVLMTLPVSFKLAEK
jgi:TonB family protein